MTLPAFNWPVRVYWEDTDAGGIVYYANYLKFFERARSEWLRTRGVAQQALLAQNQGHFVVTEFSLRYRASAKLDDGLDISVMPLELGRASLRLAQVARRVGDAGDSAGEVLCEAQVRIAWVCGGKPARIPPSVLSRLQ